MKWLKDNPLGLVLVTTCGVLALLALVMTIVWTLPEAEAIAGTSTNKTGDDKTTVLAHQVAAIGEFQVINDKPVFNTSRQPELEVENEPETEEPVEDVTVVVKDAPDVRLTGVIITPSMKIASLTPADKKLESVMAHEGQILEGEFVGWQIGSIGPRNVVLESRDGQTLDLELQVHDTAMKKPPKPKPATPAKTAQAARAQAGQLVDEDGQPLSRAEQIRIRIAERREELRREQQAQQAQSNTLGSGTAKASNPQDYQNAIRNMMRKKDNSSDDKEDG